MAFMKNTLPAVAVAGGLVAATLGFGAGLANADPPPPPAPVAMLAPVEVGPDAAAGAAGEPDDDAERQAPA